MILRNFLFLNTSTVNDYLSTLEGSVTDSPIDQTEVKKSEKSGKAGYQIIEGSAGSETSTETKQRLAITDAARFQRLYELLEKQNLIQPLDAFDTEIWNQLQRGELLEIQANIRLPDSFKLTQTIEDLSPFLDIMKAFDQDPLADPKTRAAFEGMRAIGKLIDKQNAPLVFEATATPGYQFATHLPIQHLRCELADLQGEAVVFGKVQRILKKGERLEVFSLVSALTESMKMQKQRSKAIKEITDKNVIEMIKGPAIILIPVAVYR